MSEEQSEHLAASIVEFCRFLREKGLSADLRRTITALEATKMGGVGDRRLLAYALQASLCSTREEWEMFPRLFEEFWSESYSRPRSASGEHQGSSQSNPRRSQQEEEACSTVFTDQTGGSDAAQDGDGKAAFGASAHTRLKKVDFSEVRCDDLAMLEELSLRLLRRMSLRLSRRSAPSNLADRVDLRRTIRRSVGNGGDLIDLVRKGRKPRKNKLVILLDISGSMNFYSLFLLRFAYALQSCFHRVDTFLFSTDLVEVSDLLRTRHLPEALRKLSQRRAGWSGGTKIGGSLRQLNQLHGRKLLSRETVFVILSDGWDTGEPELLAAQLRTTRRRVRKILWLNPLLGLKDYRPITRGMAAALPYVDVFAPAHNLESLMALERHL